MNLLNKLERKFGRYAIRNLMLYIIFINAVGFIMSQFEHGIYMLSYVCWDMNAILHGQVWRLITFMMWPTNDTVLNFLLFALVYYSISSALERAWGAFRLNLYIFSGILGHIIAGVLLYFLFDINYYFMNTQYLNMSLFLALALTFPDMQFLLFFLIPIKAKWMAVVYLVMILIELVNGGTAERIVIVMSLINFIAFLLLNSRAGRYNPKDMIRRHEFKRKMNQGRSGADKPLHKCYICGRTDRDFPELEFRYCSKCDGAYEYCSEHLYTHVHIRENG